MIYQIVQMFCRLKYLLMNMFATTNDLKTLEQLMNTELKKN